MLRPLGAEHKRKVVLPFCAITPAVIIGTLDMVPLQLFFKAVVLLNVHKIREIGAESHVVQDPILRVLYGNPSW